MRRNGSEEKNWKRDEEMVSFTKEEKQLITYIKEKTAIANMDNISRTRTYQEYYLRNKEVEWSFLASMVSRNAGWNMTDLEGENYSNILSKGMRKQLFLTYEKANCLIFLDAYPQLLLYEESKKRNRAFFHLLPSFYVSAFMEKEWKRFWREGNKKRLMIALIINEQNKIQKPVIENRYIQSRVLDRLLFKMQERFHLNAVVFPTLEGNLYGFSVDGFENVKKRIELGKKLAWLLFHPKYKELFYDFALHTIPTGSRLDYEQYFKGIKGYRTPQLREVFSIVPPARQDPLDWFHPYINVENFFIVQEPQEKIDVTTWFLKKQRNIHYIASFISFPKRFHSFVL
ncbi:DUF2515 family protein [Bacillus cytotoxicus]|uniref:DUF2515 family protein n=1 Tax=Bacillus cereus group sp. BfR-BA-01492 TaxID=2920361 RepID=UPI001F591643|nr:DUF2515 family protein [Bacillus cereus group sp. BfR-BA-01492]EMA6341929.1 DUF2515 family protein [Bacillus cytotoxicus]